MRIGVDRTYINKLELGLRTPKVEVLMRLAAYFECPIEELIRVVTG